MLNLKFDSNNLNIGKLAGINITVSQGRKFGCDAIGCVNEVVKTYELYEHFIKARAMDIEFNLNNSDETENCLKMIEDELETKISNPPTSPSNPLGLNNKQKLNKLNNLKIHKVKLLVDGDEKICVDDACSLNNMKISAVVSKIKRSAIISIDKFDTKAEKQIYIFREKLEDKSILRIEFS